MFFSDGTLSAVSFTLLLGITCLTVLCDLTVGSPDLSGCDFVICFATHEIQSCFLDFRKRRVLFLELAFILRDCTCAHLKLERVVCRVYFCPLGK